jgi:hypothetical protein
VIISRLEGGLGNQLFQYAAALRLATARNTRLKLDLSKLDDSRASTPRSYELGVFAVTAELASLDEVKAFTSKRGSGLLERLADRLFRGSDPPPSLERAFHFDPRVHTLPDGVYLRGYWQSERYFADVADRVRKEFSWRQKPEGKNAEMSAEISACNAVSLHVRRGDYVTDPAAHAVHGTCSIDYYRHAVDYLASKIDNPTFFLFSDDPDWVREHLELRVPVQLVDHNGPDACSEDLRLMSRCAHHIIANSTFSWWGAWLNSSPDKIVVAPKQWFADDSLDTSDLLPASWVKL